MYIQKVTDYPDWVMEYKKKGTPVQRKKDDLYFMYIPVIGTNKRRGIRSERLTVNRKIGIDLRKKYSSMHSPRWEIKRTFTILEEI
jgi:hypothetical protein